MIIQKFSKKYLYLYLPIFILLIVVVISIKKIIYLSAEPTSEKDCHLTYPYNTPQDPTKYTTITVKNSPSQIHFSQKGGIINDMSCLNQTPVFGIVNVQKEEDIKNALMFAKENNLSVSIAGVRHSMGGQSFDINSLVLDMTQFNQLSVDEKNKILKVQSGATWHDILNFINPKGLSVKAMQSSDIFTVGGSISVNAHGMDHNVGSIGSTIKSIKLMLNDGSIKTLSGTENPKLFESVIGGYGLFGVILEAEIELTDNEMYNKTTHTISYKDFPEFFKQIKANDSSGLMYGHMSVGPSSFLNEMIVYDYKKIPDFSGQLPLLHEMTNVALKRFFLNLGKTGPLGQQIRYWAEKYIQPKFEKCLTSRNQALGEPESCLVTRNRDMYESGKFLRNNLVGDTDILQEYFIPRDKFIPFVDGTRQILKDNNATILNLGVRVVNKEDIALNYAPEDMFAFVFYLNQKTIPEDNEKMKRLTQELVDLAISLNGKPYLPYQPYYSKDQLEKAYPNVNQFFEYKKEIDPEQLFSNSFYSKYSKVN